MKCSVCSHNVKPVVAIDIDGTLGDYHGHFLKFMAAYLGTNVHLNYHGKQPFKEWALDLFGIDSRTWYDIKLAYRQGAQKRSMPVNDGAADLCRVVRSIGAELWVTTARPYLRLDNIDPDTRHWLKRAGIEYSGLMFDENKYGELAQRIDPGRVVAVVDDLSDMLEVAHEVFGPAVPILKQSLYNTADSGVRDNWGRSWSLREIQDWVVGRIDTWKELNT